MHFSVLGFPRNIFLCTNPIFIEIILSSWPTNAKRPLPSLHLKVVHTHWLKLFNFQLFCIVSFYKSLHYTPYFLQTLHNICIISRLKSLQPRTNTGFIYPNSSSSGFEISFFRLVLSYYIFPIKSSKIGQQGIVLLSSCFVYYFSNRVKIRVHRVFYSNHISQYARLYFRF